MRIIDGENIGAIGLSCLSGEGKQPKFTHYMVSVTLT